jgi:hypothetical protein
MRDAKFDFRCVYLRGGVRHSPVKLTGGLSGLRVTNGSVEFSDCGGTEDFTGARRLAEYRSDLHEMDNHIP